MVTLYSNLFFYIIFSLQNKVKQKCHPYTFTLITQYRLYCNMSSEKPTYLSVDKEIQVQIKLKKGLETYSEFLKRKCGI